ncbi:MAG: hypothetical protein ACM3US_03760 [Sphingomonadaceae bacterium]
MSALERMHVDEKQLLKRLDALDWTGPLTASEIATQLAGVPEELFGDIPEGAIFHSPEEVVRALRGEVHVDAAHLPSEGAESIGGPAGYGDSTTGRLVTPPSTSHGIGSGTDTGDTGSADTTSTGWGRAGTTFGEEAVEERIEEELGGEEEELPERG